ncbi:MAG: ABC transporter ATP-binding protein [Archaeoglobaceae archaeon]
MIICENVSKRFGETFALKDVSLSFEKSIAILGRNGAGKSTLAKILAGITKPTQGRVSVFGEDPFKNVDIRRKISIVTHNPMLYKELSVEENLRFFAKLYGIKDWEWVIHELKLEGKLNSKVFELSRGYLQRVAIAKALMLKPKLLILDEPFSSLDVEGKEILWAKIHEFKHSIVFSTHSLNEARFCENFAVLEKGELVYFGRDYDEALRALRTREEGSKDRDQE